jgi:hypothetical protein
MDLSKIAKEPKLVKISLEDAETIKQYGEPLEFYTWDRTPIDKFFKLASLDNTSHSSLLNAVKDLILDAEGKPIITEKNTLPNDVLIKVITAVVQGLGKSQK